MSDTAIKRAREVAKVTARMTMKHHIKRMPLPELTDTDAGDLEAHRLTFMQGARAMREQILKWDYDSGPSLKDLMLAAPHEVEKIWDDHFKEGKG